MKSKAIRRKNYIRKEPSHDWLKYWRVVRYWVRENYGLSLADLELLLFLYSEDLFSYKDFEEYEKVMSWDIKRFRRLTEDDWIVKCRNHNNQQSALFTLSYKGKRLMLSIYKKLNGEETITENPYKNVLFKKDASIPYQRYATMIVEMNKAITKNLNR